MKEIAPGTLAKLRFARHGLRTFFDLQVNGHAALTGKPEKPLALRLPVGREGWHEMSPADALALAEALTELAERNLE